MNVFDTLPDNFFSPLASLNKHIYLKALFVIHKCFQYDWRLKKEDLVYVIADEMMSDANFFSFNDEGDVDLHLKLTRV